MNAVAAIVRANLVRMRNDRANIFFMVILPLLIVFALGAAIGGAADEYVVGVVDPAPTSASRAVRAAVEDVDGVRTESVADARTLRDQVARRVLSAGWVAEHDGTRVTVRWVAGADPGATVALQGVVRQAAGQVGMDRAVEAVVAARTGVPAAQVAEAAQRAADQVPAPRVEVERVVDGRSNDARTITAVVASGQLTLFIFLTSLFGAGNLFESRTLGVTRRTLAAPVAAWQVIVGEAAARYAVAIIQAVVIIAGTIVLFGIDWQAPLAVAALCAVMALVGTGAAMLLGTLGRSAQQVTGMSLLLGLVLAAFGGSMQPLEFFPSAMRTAAFVLTPHAWMNSSLWDILVDGAGLADVWTHVVVLAAVGAVLITVAARLMRRHLAV